MSGLKEFLLLNTLFPIADKVKGTKAMYWFRQIRKMESWSQEEIENWQLSKMKLLINHAYNHTVYYREIFDILGLKPSNINSFDDLRKLPVLDKSIIKSRFKDFVPDNINDYKHRYNLTGGSTGTPFKYILDENTWGFVTALKMFSFMKTSYNFGDTYVSIGSASLFPVNKKSFIHEIYFRLRNTIPLNGMNMDDEVCARYIGIIKKYNVKYIYGYATSVYLLASYARKYNVEMKIKGVFTTSENLTDDYRKVIESTWGVQVMNCYGARDGGVTAYEVNRGYFNVGYNSYCQTDTSEEISSTMYCTNLIDYAFPLIRYTVGDDVVLSKNNDKYNGQVFKEITGRTSDIIQLDNGHKLTPTGFSIMSRGFNIAAFRMTKINGLFIKLEIQKLESYTIEEEKLILETMKKHVGNECEILLEYVPIFEPLKNGKRNFFINTNV